MLDYKARLITAEEIVEIVRNTSFNENTTICDQFYFDENIEIIFQEYMNGTKTYEEYIQEKEKYFAENEIKHGWLYDRTSIECKINGCRNNSDIFTFGYWTGTSAFGYRNESWGIIPEGQFETEYAYGEGKRGVRPVIEVLKSNLE